MITHEDFCCLLWIQVRISWGDINEKMKASNNFDNRSIDEDSNEKYYWNLDRLMDPVVEENEEDMIDI